MADKETKTTKEVEQTTDEATTEEEEYTFEEDPKFKIDYKGECAYEVKVTVPVANEAKESETMFAELKGEVELPGFRRGRAPLKLVEKKFSKAVKGDVERRLVTESFKKLIKDEDLNPIDQPDIDGFDEETERKEGEPITFTLKFEVSPKVELGKYRGITIERPIVKIDAKAVKAAIDEMQKRGATLETLEDGVAAEEDQVVMDFEGKIDGETFQGGSATDYPYILGSKHFFPEFETALLGSSTGDELSCDIKFPKDYSAENLRGKKANFTINVKEIKRRNLPEIDDDFAKKSGHDDLKDMKAKVKETLQKTADEQSKSATESRAIKTIIDDSKFEIPKSMIAGVTKNYHDEEVERMMSMRIPAASIEEMDEEINERAAKRALASIKSTVLMGEIGEAEGVEVTDDDFEKEAENLAARYDTDINVVTKFMSQDDQRSSYANRILFSKTMAVIMDNAEITEKKMTAKQFEKQQAEEE